MSGDHDAPAETQEQGVEHGQVSTMTVLVDPATLQVSFRCSTAPIAFWQMVVDEVGRQLEGQRRAAAALMLRGQLEQQGRTAAILDQVARDKRGH